MYLSNLKFRVIINEGEIDLVPGRHKNSSEKIREIYNRKRFKVANAKAFANYDTGVGYVIQEHLFEDGTATIIETTLKQEKSKVIVVKEVVQKYRNIMEANKAFQMHVECFNRGEVGELSNYNFKQYKEL